MGERVGDAEDFARLLGTREAKEPLGESSEGGDSAKPVAQTVRAPSKDKWAREFVDILHGPKDDE